MDGFGWAHAASGTLCQSKVQDSNDEACSEVAEVPYKVRGRNSEKNKEERQNNQDVCMCFVGRETILLILTNIFNSSNNKIASKKRGRDQLVFCFPKRQALRQARAETAALSCRSDIPEVWMGCFFGGRCWAMGWSGNLPSPLD